MKTIYFIIPVCKSKRTVYYSLGIINRGVKIHQYESVTIFNIKDATTSIRGPLYQIKFTINHAIAQF